MQAAASSANPLPCPPPPVLSACGNLLLPHLNVGALGGACAPYAADMRMPQLEWEKGSASVRCALDPCIGPYCSGAGGPIWQVKGRVMPTQLRRHGECTQGVHSQSHRNTRTYAACSLRLRLRRCTCISQPRSACGACLPAPLFACMLGLSNTPDVREITAHLLFVFLHSLQREGRGPCRSHTSQGAHPPDRCFAADRG
jgi:hypothetical protein